MGLPVPKPKPTVLLTRPRAQSESFAQDLRANGFDGKILISPLMQIEPTGAVVDLEQVDGVIFTSRNAVEFAPNGAKQAWCVGEKTVEVAQRKGWQTISADGDVDALLQQILASRPTGKLLHLRGEHSRGAVTQRLRDAGYAAEELVVYRQAALTLSGEARERLSGESPVIVPLFSPRSAALFVNSGPFVAPIWGVAMSKAVADEMKSNAPDKLLVAKAPKAELMRKSVLSLVKPA